jgi:hypothetical protein
MYICYIKMHSRMNFVLDDSTAAMPSTQKGRGADLNGFIFCWSLRNNAIYCMQLSPRAHFVPKGFIYHSLAHDRVLAFEGGGYHFYANVAAIRIVMIAIYHKSSWLQRSSYF